MTSPITHQAGVHGFTLVELAVVLAVMGLLIWTVSSSYLNLDDVADRQAAELRRGEARDALRAFALANARLPCPDAPMNLATPGDGREDCGPGIATGWLPYETLGLAQPTPALRAQYGVYRPPVGGAADLSRAMDRSGDGTINPNDLIRGLNTAATAAFDSARIHLAGRSATIDCSSAPRRNVAYFVVVPLADRDDATGRFDSIHPGLCAYAPSTGAAHDRDDVVGAGGFAGLSGWLRSQ